MDDLIIINLPIQEVFAFVTDHANDRLWKPFVTESMQVSAGSIGVGALFEIVTVTWNYRMAGQIEVLEYKPYSWYVYRSNSQPFSFIAQLSFTPMASGTHIHGQVEFQAQGLWKLFTPLIQIFFKSQEKRTFSQLKQVMESAK